MSAEPVTIEGTASVNEALAAMRDRGLSCLVVTARRGRRVRPPSHLGYRARDFEP